MKQTYADLEIILVDDGSTDRSSLICDGLQREDKRIVVIHKENAGQSDARNCGIERASGEWIVFVDGDDFIHPMMIDRLYKLAIDYQGEMVSCGFQTFSGEETSEIEWNNREKIYIFENDKYYQIDRLEMVVPWNKIYKKSLFSEIRYPKGHVIEDECVIHHLVGACKRIIHTEENFYAYMIRDGSTMSIVSKKRIDDLMYAMEDRIAYFKDKDLNELQERTCNQTVNSLIMCGFHSSCYPKVEKKYIYGILNRYLQTFCEKYSELLSCESKKQKDIFLKSPSRCFRYRKNREIRNKIKNKIKRIAKRSKSPASRL